MTSLLEGEIGRTRELTAAVHAKNEGAQRFLCKFEFKRERLPGASPDYRHFVVQNELWTGGRGGGMRAVICRLNRRSDHTLPRVHRPSGHGAEKLRRQRRRARQHRIDDALRRAVRVPRGGAVQEWATRSCSSRSRRGSRWVSSSSGWTSWWITMGTRIEAVATAHAGRGPFRQGALKLADAAARACLARAHLEAGDIDLLINAGLYREDNLTEPALAALIQEDIGANPGHPPREGAHGTFSFDVANGGCGVLTALELLDGFVRSGTIQTGLVVASDSEPDDSESFPFPAVGGAVLVRPTRGGEGFVDFAFETFDEAAGSLRERHQLAREGLAPPAVKDGDERADGRARRRVRMPGDRVRRGGDAPVPGAARGRREIRRPRDPRASHRWAFADGLAARLDLRARMRRARRR